MHLEWSDISFAHRTLQVRSKPHHGHRIKDAEERELTLTDDRHKPGWRRSVLRKDNAGHRLSVSASEGGR